ncbi:MAG: isoleucine--tRNA ligase, partial [Acidobacteria bacterium]|nr:isoleucine--tRNA ligase [Acidobacteriota bacterium]
MGSGRTLEGRFDPHLWERVMTVREVVAKELEGLRVAGRIGSSLDAEVHLYCNGALYHSLSAFEDELRFVMITSAAQVHALAQAGQQTKDTVIPELKLAVLPSAQPKCGR